MLQTLRRASKVTCGLYRFTLRPSSPAYKVLNFLYLEKAQNFIRGMRIVCATTSIVVSFYIVYKVVEKLLN